MNERVKQLRIAKGLTLKKMGEALGVSLTAISEIEHGRSQVTERTIKMILATFPDVSEEWLRTGDGDMFRTAADDQVRKLLSDLVLPDVATRFVDVYLRLTPDQQRTVNDYVRQVVASLMETYKEEATEELSDAPEELTIDQKVELFRQQLIAEREAAGKSSASTGTA